MCVLKSNWIFLVSLSFLNRSPTSIQTLSYKHDTCDSIVPDVDAIQTKLHSRCSLCLQHSKEYNKYQRLLIVVNFVQEQPQGVGSRGCDCTLTKKHL